MYFACALAEFSKFLFSRYNPPPNASAAVVTHPIGPIPASIGAKPATADAPISPIPTPILPVIIAADPAIPRPIDNPPDTPPIFC